MLKQYFIEIKGVVQGVGFRPFIYRLAVEMGINGIVYNDNKGVTISVQTTREKCEKFMEKIKEHAPAASDIISYTVHEEPLTDLFEGFHIDDSRDTDDGITGISPDLAVCDKCMEEVSDPHDNRYRYPFINCTSCGPRFSIIKSLPYDRHSTTMTDFDMCPNCSSEFSDIASRRFHAQPVCCDDCGPHYSMLSGTDKETDYEKILDRICRSISEGGIVALKGTGGYNLLCLPHLADTVMRLRNIKGRKNKPFALMFRDIDAVKRYALLSKEEELALISPRRPVVLLQQIRSAGKGVNDGYATIGAILPYMPVHYDIFEKTGADTLVFTSANRENTPILKDEEEVMQMFSSENIPIVNHNREIYNRVDDSVITFVRGKESVIRRSRGYAPESIETGTGCDGILALGGEMNSTFAIGRGTAAIPSQYIGDTGNRESASFYKEMLEHYCSLFRFSPGKVVCDYHPGYFTTRLAEDISHKYKIGILRVQHHHAHTAAVMAEYGIDRTVLSLALDGVGLGDDGSMWGGELLACTPVKYRRLAHFPAVAMPGGNAASRMPWRMAVSYVDSICGHGAYPKGFVERVGEYNVSGVEHMIHSGINTPLSSGAGRLFDAVSSLLGICDVNSYQGEAAIKLEQLSNREETGRYPIDRHSPLKLNLLMEAMLYDMQRGVAVCDIAARFHNTLAYMLKTAVLIASKKYNITDVVLCGGVFQNKILSDLLIRGMEESGLNVYYPSKLPCNDSALAVGQLFVASKTV